MKNSFLTFQTKQIYFKLCENVLLTKLQTFISSGHIEVQERATSAFMLIQMLHEQFPHANSIDKNNQILPDIIDKEPSASTNEIPIGAIEIVQEMALLFAGDLNPVAPKAQRKVQIPEDLDLDEWINQPPSESSSSSDEEQTDLFWSGQDRKVEHTKTVEPSPEELQKVFSFFFFSSFELT